MIYSEVHQPLTVMENHYIPRPIRLTDISQVEEPWRLTCLDLERKYIELMLQFQESTLKIKDRRSTFYESPSLHVRRLERDIEQLGEQLQTKNEELDSLKSFNKEDYILNNLKHRHIAINTSLSLKKQQLSEIQSQIKGMKAKPSDIHIKIG